MSVRHRLLKESWIGIVLPWRCDWKIPMGQFLAIRAVGLLVHNLRPNYFVTCLGKTDPIVGVYVEKNFLEALGTITQSV
jgi:hypothetical protein